MLAIKAGGTGHVTDAQIAWRLTEFTPDVPTPLYCQNMLFVLDGNRQMMTCLDPNTGAKKWQGSLGVKEVFSASPTAADGKIYCISENGTAVVLSAGDEFKILSTITMGESPVMSSIAIAAGRLLIRTSRNLYCIAGKPPDARP
jgi:outer membrane protein assembly factor BamB